MPAKFLVKFFSRLMRKAIFESMAVKTSNRRRRKNSEKRRRKSKRILIL